MANHLKMADCETFVALHRQGWSKRKLARELGVDRGTVRRVLSAGSSKAPTPVEVRTGSEAAKAPTSVEVRTGAECAGTARGAARSECEPYRPLIERKIAAGLSVQRLFQDLLEG